MVSERLQEALARNWRRRVCPEELRKVAGRLEKAVEDLSLLDPKSSKELFECCEARLRACMEETSSCTRYVYLKGERETLLGNAERLAVHLPQLTVMLFDRLGDECGAVAMTVPEAIRYAAKFSNDVDEDIAAATEDGSSGFWVSYGEQYFGEDEAGRLRPLSHPEAAALYLDEMYVYDGFEFILWGQCDPGGLGTGPSMPRA